MILTATINEVKRRVTFDNPNAVVAVKGDYEVNGVAFAFPAIYEDDFDLSTAVKTVYYKATDGIIYNHVVTDTDTDTGYPLWVFKDEINKGAFGDVEFALVCDKVEGGNIVKRWVSMITVFRVQRSIEIDESEQEENEQTYSERLADLMTQMANMQVTVSGLASGAPTPVSLASAMTDTSKLYVYTGSESGYTAGHWYYYNGSAWDDGGQYGGISVDTTLTVSGAAADAKKTGDEISQIKEDLSAKLTLTANGSDTIPDNADFNDYKTAGTYKVTNNTHAGTMTNIPVKTAGKLIVLELSQTARVIQIYILATTTYPIYTRYYQNTTSGESWSMWDGLCKISTLTAVGDRVSTIEETLKLPKIKYESGSFEGGDATERISVYIPATTGYLMYRLYHFIDNTINCNCWQIYNLYYVNESLGGQTDLTAKGEWECALHLAGRDDFSGGHTHGDELLTSLTVLLDGVPVDISTLTATTDFDKLTIIRASKLYDPSNHTTEIAEHGVEYTFNKDGLTVRQSIKWLVSAELTNCFLAMFPPLKSKIDRAFFNSRFDIAELASATSESISTVTASKATCTTIWDVDGGLSGTISIPSYPTGLTGGDTATIGDNGGLSYNKLYYKVCGTGYSSSVGETWTSKSIYSLNFGT